MSAFFEYHAFRILLASTEVPIDGLESTTDFGWLLVKTTLILIAVCLLSYLFIRFLARRMSSLGRGSSTKLEVMDRLVLEHRRSIYVVRAGSRTVLLGAGESEVTLLCELDGEEWTDMKSAEPDRDVFRRVLAEVGRKDSSAREAKTGQDRAPRKEDGQT